MLRRNASRLCFQNPSSLCKSDVVFPLSLLRFSTSAVAQSAVYEFLVHKHHFSPKFATGLASAVPRLKNPERADSLLSFLKDSGFSISQLEEILKVRPNLLSVDLEKYKPKISIFQEFGISASDAAEIIANDPRILYRGLNSGIIPSLSLLTNLLGSTDLIRVLKASGWFLKFNLSDTLIPNIELLNECGINMDQIVPMMCQYPRLLLRKPEDMQKIVDKVDAMGARRTSTTFFHAIRVIGSYTDEAWELKLRTLREVGFSDDGIAAAFRKSPWLFGLSEETWKRKHRTLREVGFSDDDILTACRNAPQLFSLSEERIKEAKEVLLTSGKYDVSCIVRTPVSLMLSIEKRIKPRMQVLELLEHKNLIKKWPCFGRFCCMSNNDFYGKYVAPFLEEVGDVYTAKSSSS